ncbi:MAG: histidine triad nucleotide-binding protein [Campylobacterales bacterium]
MSDCIFCKIAQGEIPSNKEYEDEHTLVFHDIHPQAPVHLLVIPKKHIPSFNEVDDQTLAHMRNAVHLVTRKMGLDHSGYRLIFNVGRDGGQEVGHLHWHILGGAKLKWGSFVDDPHRSI